MTDQKNMFIAIGLSLAILIGWQYFYGIPMAEKQRQAAEQQRIIQQAEQAQQQAPAQPQPGDAAGAAIPGTPAGATAAGRAMTREAALAATPRIAIDTPRLKGSIALKGGRVDDLSLLDYHETVDPQSPHIVLLAPAGSPHPFYAEFGWTTAPGATMKVPGPDTVWTASTGALTPKAPLVLTYDNGEGLLFKRTYTVDENYMFAVKDEVENKGTGPVTLYPYALVTRQGLPKTEGFYILHEGMIGVLGDSGLQETTYSKLEDGQPHLFKATGGWLGITDKYWAATVIPDHEVPRWMRASPPPPPTMSAASRPTISAAARPWRPAAPLRPTASCLPAPRWWPWWTAIRSSTASTASTC